MAERYVVVNLNNGKFDVVHCGPYTVAKSLKYQEALALAAALNEENKGK